MLGGPDWAGGSDAGSSTLVVAGGSSLDFFALNSSSSSISSSTLAKCSQSDGPPDPRALNRELGPAGASGAGVATSFLIDGAGELVLPAYWACWFRMASMAIELIESERPKCMLWRCW